MFTTLRNAWKIPELRKKLLFTLMILLIFRVGNAVPVPYVDVEALSNYFRYNLSNTILGLYNAMSGSAFSQATLFALGIQPYINASIIIELLTIAIPALERLAKEEGEEGKKKLNRITRYTTVGLGLLLGWAYYMMLQNYGLLATTGFFPAVVVILSFTAGRQPGHVARRADHGVWHRQRYFHYLVCGYHFPCSQLGRNHDFQPTDRVDSVVGLHPAGDWYAAVGCVYRLHHQRRTPDPDPICKTGCWPQSIRWTKYPFAH